MAVPNAVGSVLPQIFTGIGAAAGPAGASTGAAIGSVLNSLNQADNARREREETRNIDFSNYGLTPDDPVKRALDAQENTRRAKDIGAQSNTNDVYELANSIRQQTGLDAPTSMILAQKAANAAADANQSRYQKQQAYDYTLGQQGYNQSAQRDLISQGVQAAAKNVTDQLNSLSSARDSNNRLLMGATSGMADLLGRGR